MAENIVNFKYGTDITDSSINTDDLVAINKGMEVSDSSVESKFGSFYKGSKILGTTESDKLCLTEDIEVAGLGTLGAGISDGQVIPKGTTLQEFLSMLLQKELWPNSLTVTNNKPSVTFAAPAFTLSQSGTVEVGTACVLSDSTITAASANNATKVLGTFTYGYSTSDNDTQEQKGTTVTLTSTDAALDTTPYTMTQTFTGFSSATPGTVESSTNVGSVVITGQTLTVSEGTNSVKVDATSPKATCTLPASSDYYACSNLKHTDAAHKLAATSTLVQTSESSSKTTTKSVTGNYKWFMGYSAHTTASEFTSEEVRALNAKASSWITVNGTTTILENGTKLSTPGGTSGNLIIAIPEKYKLATITGDLGNALIDYNNPGTSVISTTPDTIDVSTGTINTKYKIYIMQTAAVTVYQNVTVTKA